MEDIKIITDEEAREVAGGYWSKRYEDRYCSQCKRTTPHLIHTIINDDGSGSITKRCNSCGLTTPD